MASRTNTDLIRELGQRVAAIEEQIGVLRESVRDIYKLIREDEFRLASLEQKAIISEERRRERSARTSVLWASIVSALAAIVGAIAGALASEYFRHRPLF